MSKRTIKIAEAREEWVEREIEFPYYYRWDDGKKYGRVMEDGRHESIQFYSKDMTWISRQHIAGLTPIGGYRVQAHDAAVFSYDPSTSEEWEAAIAEASRWLSNMRSEEVRT